MLFRDRADAGRILAARLGIYANRHDVIVMALPRGGVPVGFEVARVLHAPLDVFVVRKLGVPGEEELAMGAVATGGVRVLNESVIQTLGIPAPVVESVARREEEEVRRRERAYRDDRPQPELENRTVILVDDGLATGSTMRAAVRALRAFAPERIVVAVPTGSPQACEQFRGVVDEVVCAATPEPFHSVGVWYDDFSQTSDAEVHNLLQRAAAMQPAAR